jgi:putative DNA primase/helicase
VSRVPEEPGDDDVIPFAPDEAEVADEPAGRPSLSLVDQVVEVHRDGPESRVWNLLDLAKVKNSDPPKFFPKSSPSNVHYVLSQDSRWCGRVRTNDFDGNLYLDSRTVTDRDLTDIVHWLERVYSLRTTEERVAKTLVVCGDEHVYHPIREWLSGLVWDGAPRLAELLGGYLGAASGGEGGPSAALLSTLGRCFLISCVARVMAPGCKVDTTLILVGKQGAKKSTACRILANGWFSDTLLDLHTKDLYESIQGVWLYELAELDAFNRGDWAKVKAILSSPDDRWRRPYGKSVQARPRQCVFLGTTNQDHFLGDSTGSRRFWPVRVGIVDTMRLARDATQLWAEALALYRQGVPWWLDPQSDLELAGVSVDFAIVHPWASPIADWLRSNQWGEITTAELLAGPCKREIGSWTRNDEAEVGAVLRRMGFHGVRKRVGGERRWVWVREP